MCPQEPEKKKSRAKYFILAVILGIIAGYTDFESVHQLITAIAAIISKVFRIISLPIIFLSLITTIISQGQDGASKKIFNQVLYYTFITTILAAATACLFYLIIRPENVQLRLGVNQPDFKTSYIEFIIKLIPTNLITPFIEYNVIVVLIMAKLIGSAVKMIANENAKKVTTEFFLGLYSIFVVLTRWLVRFLPIGFFGFVGVTVLEIRAGVDISGLWKYLTVVLSANLFQGMVILPIFLRWNGISVWETVKGMMPALSFAFFCKSSAATLPITMETAEKRLYVSKSTSQFVLPLVTAINMNGCAAFIFTTVVYLMQNQGIPLTPLTYMIWIVIATIAAIANAGVPMGCYFLSASLLTTMNVPINLLTIILPFYSVIDMLETSLNVFSDSCVLRVINKKIPSAPMAEP